MLSMVNCLVVIGHTIEGADKLLWQSGVGSWGKVGGILGGSDLVVQRSRLFPLPVVLVKKL